jgi:hypothetical protein
MFAARYLERIVQLERSNAQLATSAQWLQALVNQLQAERTALLERVLAVQLPSPTIVTLPGMPPGARARTAEEPEPFDLVAAFEDMGDAQAAMDHVRHTPDGFVER